MYKFSPLITSFIDSALLGFEYTSVVSNQEGLIYTNDGVI